MSAAVLQMPEAVPDEALLCDVVRDACARQLMLVIDRHGRCLLTRQLLPGMHVIHIVDKDAA